MRYSCKNKLKKGTSMRFTGLRHVALNADRIVSPDTNILADGIKNYAYSLGVWFGRLCKQECPHKRTRCPTLAFSVLGVNQCHKRFFIQIWSKYSVGS